MDSVFKDLLQICKVWEVIVVARTYPAKPLQNKTSFQHRSMYRSECYSGTPKPYTESNPFPNANPGFES